MGQKSPLFSRYEVSYCYRVLVDSFIVSRAVLINYLFSSYLIGFCCVLTDNTNTTPFSIYKRFAKTYNMYMLWINTFRIYIYLTIMLLINKAFMRFPSLLNPMTVTKSFARFSAEAETGVSFRRKLFAQEEL